MENTLLPRDSMKTKTDVARFCFTIVSVFLILLLLLLYYTIYYIYLYLTIREAAGTFFISFISCYAEFLINVIKFNLTIFQLVIIWLVFTLSRIVRFSTINIITYVFGDNDTMIKSSTIPHARLHKRHNILSFHFVRSTISWASAVLPEPSCPIKKMLKQVTTWHRCSTQKNCVLQPLSYLGARSVSFNTSGEERCRR